MVKVPPLGLLTTVLCAVLVSATYARPLPPHHQHQHLHQLPRQQHHPRRPAPSHHASHDALLPVASYAAARGGTEPLRPRAHPAPPAPPAPPRPSPGPGLDDFEDDGSARSERSTNLSALYGPGRPMRMYINDRHLQILADGTVNGTHDENDNTILHRLSVNKTQVKIQGLATCLFLCMDSCGLLYGSEAATEECVFTEKIHTQINYNTYSSARYSNAKRTLYVALNKNGRPRKLQLRAGASFGKLMQQSSVLPIPLDPWRVMEQLRRKTAALRGAPASAAAAAPGEQPLPRHLASHLCPRVAAAAAPPRREQDEAGRDNSRCRGRKKRGKKKRRCRKDEPESELCEKRPGRGGGAGAGAGGEATAGAAAGARRPKKCLEGEAEAACKKRLRLERRRRKARLGADKRGKEDDAATGARKKPKRPKAAGKGADGIKVAGSADGQTAEGARRRNKLADRKDKQQQNQRDLAKGVVSEVKAGGKGGDAVTMTPASSGATRQEATAAATTTESRPSSQPTAAVATPAAPVATTKVERSAPTRGASPSVAAPSPLPPAAPAESTEPLPGTTGEAAGAGRAETPAAAERPPTAPQGASLVAEPDAVNPAPAPAPAGRRAEPPADEPWESSGSAPPLAADY